MEEPYIFEMARTFDYGFPYLITGLAIFAAISLGLFRIYQEKFRRKTREEEDDHLFIG